MTNDHLKDKAASGCSSVDQQVMVQFTQMRTMLS